MSQLCYTWSLLLQSRSWPGITTVSLGRLQHTRSTAQRACRQPGLGLQHRRAHPAALGVWLAAVTVAAGARLDAGVTCCGLEGRGRTARPLSVGTRYPRSRGRVLPRLCPRPARPQHLHSDAASTPPPPADTVSHATTNPRYHRTTSQLQPSTSAHRAGTPGDGGSWGGPGSGPDINESDGFLVYQHQTFREANNAGPELRENIVNKIYLDLVGNLVSMDLFVIHAGLRE